MPLSTTEDNLIADAVHGNIASYSSKAPLYFGLSSTTPNKAGGGVTEPSAGGYARVQVPAAFFGSAAGSVLSNTAEIAFPTASADWLAGANLTNLVIYDAASAGNFVGFKALNVAKPVTNGDTAKFAIGAYTFTVAGAA